MHAYVHFFPQTIQMICAFSIYFTEVKRKNLRSPIYKANHISKIAYIHFKESRKKVVLVVTKGFKIPANIWVCLWIPGFFQQSNHWAGLNSTGQDDNWYYELSPHHIMTPSLSPHPPMLPSHPPPALGLGNLLLPTNSHPV